MNYSFARIVKDELVQLNTDKEEQGAELFAMIDLASEIGVSGGVPTLWFKSNNPTVSRRFLKMIKNRYKIENSLLTKKQGNFAKKEQIYVGITEKIDDIILEFGIFGDQDASDFLTNTPETKLAYLRGAFLTAGSVNDPKTAEYHLEIYAEDKDIILKIQGMMNIFELNAKITKRRKGLIVYLKDATKIEDFLRLIGASDTVFEYEDIRIKRDFNNSINRILNCELANEKKTIVAAHAQLKDIEFIETHHIRLNEKLLQVAKLRKMFPEDSLNELLINYEKTFNEKITKSGLNHRFKKLNELAVELRKGT